VAQQKDELGPDVAQQKDELGQKKNEERETEKVVKDELQC
jgi:hypothetical protein